MPSVRSGMSIGILLMLILFSLFMVLSASKADAQTAPCATEFDNLETALLAAGQTKLVSKVTSAETKLSEGKTEDALVKITDIEVAVDRLVAGEKLDPDDATAIDAAVADARVCIGSTSSV